MRVFVRTAAPAEKLFEKRERRKHFLEDGFFFVSAGDEDVATTAAIKRVKGYRQVLEKGEDYCLDVPTPRIFDGKTSILIGVCLPTGKR